MRVKLSRCETARCVYRFICLNNPHEGRRPKAMDPELVEDEGGHIHCLSAQQEQKRGRE